MAGMNNDQDDGEFRLMPLGDIGTLVLALMFFVGFLWLMFGPSPFAELYQKLPNRPQPSPRKSP